MTKTFLQDGLDAYARGDYLAAARAWCRGRIGDPKDPAAGQYLEFLRSVAPAVVAGAEEEAAAHAKADRPPAAVVREPSGTITPLIDAPDRELRLGRTIDMRPTGLRPGKTIDMRGSAEVPEAEDFPEPPTSRSEEGKAEWSPRPAEPAATSDASMNGPSHTSVSTKAYNWLVAITADNAPSGAKADNDAELAPRTPAPDAAAEGAAPEPQPRAEGALAAMPDRRAADPWGEPALLGPTASVDSSAPGLGLVAAASANKHDPSVSVASLVSRMRDAAGLDDFSGALKAADELLAIEPLNVDAKRIRDRARSVLTQMLVSELGTLDAIPMIAVAADQVIWLDLDQRAGFVLAQVDGRSSFSDIVAVTGMDELETLGILARLLRDKIVVAR